MARTQGLPPGIKVLERGWLSANNIPLQELLMREDTDFRPAGTLKADLALRHFATEQGLRDNVAFLIDDNEGCIAAFQAMGITALQVFGRRLP